MADNIVIQQASTPGATVSSEDIGSGIQLSRSKLVIGVHGVDSGDVASGNPLPVIMSAGSAKVGIVTTDQTTHGTTDLVAADITKIAGTAISQGHGTAATAIRVELPTDGTGVVNLASGSNVGIANSVRGTLTDRSGTITSGGTAQSLASSNSSRNYLLIQNNSSNPLWINFGTTAVQSQPSIQLVAGAVYEMISYISTQSISIIGGTTSQAFTAKEG